MLKDEQGQPLTSVPAIAEPVPKETRIIAMNTQPKILAEVPSRKRGLRM